MVILIVRFHNPKIHLVRNPQVELECQAKEIRKKDFNTQIRFSKGQLGLFRRKKGSKDEWEKVDKS